MSSGRLILTPADADLALPLAALLEKLRQLGLCGEELPGRPGRYAIGEDFMRWISFAGCSAFIRFEPESEQDQAFCHLALHALTGPRPLFLAGTNSKPPTCPNCRKAWPQWSTLMADWQQQGEMPVCPGCRERIDPRQLNWRRHAGMGRTLVELFNIFPGEARPVPTLLAQLGTFSDGADWRYFYLQ